MCSSLAIPQLADSLALTKGDNWAMILGDNRLVDWSSLPGQLTMAIFSSPFPEKRGYTGSVEEWFIDLHGWVSSFLPALRHDGVIVHEVMFGRDDEGFWDHRVLEIPGWYRRMFGFGAVNVYPWDKLNAPPSGDTERHDYQEWSMTYVMSMQPNVRRRKWLKDYSYKTVAKAAKAEADQQQITFDWAPDPAGMRKADVAGNMAGGHDRINEDGAMAGNMIRMSNSADEKLPYKRVEGGSTRRGWATRFIWQYTDPGDLVLDPFAGRGTFGVDAIDIGRQFIGIDISQSAYETACHWLADHEALIEGRDNE